jgi:hypothetical protein
MPHLTIPLDAIDGTGLLQDWHWLLSGSHRLLAVTRMGDAFVEMEHGGVIFLDTVKGAVSHAAPDQDAFFRLLQAGALDPTWFNPDMVVLLEARSEYLAPGQCYSYKLPRAVGGSFEPANVEATNALLHFSIMGQIHEQIRGLPSGTKIRRFIAR